MELRDYQKQDIQRIRAVTKLGLFSEQRTGKTPTAVVAVSENLTQKVLVICPASLMYNWSSEFKVWTGRTSVVVDKMTTDYRGSNVVIVNYEKLANTKTHKGLVDDLIKYKFDWLIVDEAHRIKNRQAAVSKAVIKLAHKIPNRLAITGTPAHDKPEDVFNILRFIDYNTFTSYYRFIEEWCEMENVYTPRGVVNKPAGILPKKKLEFAKLLDEHYGIMHKRNEVMDWDTEQDVIDIRLPLTPKQKHYLDELLNYFETKDENTEVITQGVLDRITRYRQICNAPGILELSGNSPKIDWIVRYLKEYPDNSVIIFSNSRKFLNLLEDKISCPVLRIDGTISKQLRKSNVDTFQRGECKVILIQTQAGKEGLTLDRADTTIFCDVFPPSSDYLQAKDRAVASKPEMVKPKTVFRLMMDDSYDEQLYVLVDKNIKQSAVINNFIEYIRRYDNE